MKPCIIETHYHSELINTLIQIYPKSDVYTIKSVYDDLPDSAKSLVNTFFFVGSRSKKSFIDSIPTQDYDLCFVNTIQETMLDLKNWKNFKPKCKSVLTLHNLNAWYMNSLFPQPRLNLIHSVDSWWSQKHLSDILSRFDYLSVCYEPMLQCAETYFKQPVLFIPFALAQDSVIPESHDDIWFTIPGTVSHKRRNYLPVIDTFNKLLLEFPNIRLYLLGKNEDNIEFTVLPETEDRIVTFSSSVPRVQYDQILRDSDFVIIPSIEWCNTINVTDEHYGYTKSPNIHEAIKWRKPFIVPSTLPVPDKLKTSCLTYKDQDELYNHFCRLLSSGAEKNLLRNRALKNTEGYVLKKTQNRLVKQLN